MQRLDAEITDVVEALDNLTEHGTVDPMVKAMVNLSKLSLVSVQDTGAGPSQVR